jgi:hypothetical protein
MLCPGDIVTSSEGWDGLPIFDKCYCDRETQEFGAIGVAGNLSSQDVGIVIAVVSSFIFIITPRAQMGWMHRDCLILIR